MIILVYIDQYISILPCIRATCSESCCFQLVRRKLHVGHFHIFWQKAKTASFSFGTASFKNAQHTHTEIKDRSPTHNVLQRIGNQAIASLLPNHSKISQKDKKRNNNMMKDDES